MWSTSLTNATTRPGTSLVELLIACALCVCALQLAMALGTFFDRTTVRAALDELYAQCTYAHMKALIGAQDQTIRFDVDKRTYCVQDAAIPLPSRVRFGAVSGAKGPPYSPTQPITTPVTFKDAAILCKDNGTIRPGSIYIADSAGIYGYALTVAVSPYTYMRCYEYHDQTWHRVT